jgi:TRAP-type C4-dicarboxylate transport system permease large subunit
MDPTPAVIILAPILMPVLIELGMHPVHIGVMMCFNLIQGQITPPVGSCLFLASGISHLPIETIVKATIPFYIANTLALFAITYIPFFVMFIPSLFGV